MFVDGPVSSNEPYLLVAWLSVERFVSCVATGELSRILGLGLGFGFAFGMGLVEPLDGRGGSGSSYQVLNLSCASGSSPCGARLT